MGINVFAIGLVLTICTALSNGAEDCDSQRYVLDAFTGKDAVTDCVAEMDKRPQRRDDRYLSCEDIDPRWLSVRAQDGNPSIDSQLRALEEMP